MKSREHSALDNGTKEKLRCVLASGNQGKLKELTGVLTDFNIELISQSEFNLTEAIEDANTFVENALIKARHACNYTDLCAMADDSGLVVPALNGEPGIRSARYAMAQNATENATEHATEHATEKPTDQDNINKLLAELEPLPEAARSAYFVCSLVFLRHAKDPEPVIANGIWHGTILKEPEGEGGFGYDPVFYCPANGMSAAAMGKPKKATVSHRALALQELKKQLQQKLLHGEL